MECGSLLAQYCSELGGMRFFLYCASKLPHSIGDEPEREDRYG